MLSNFAARFPVWFLALDLLLHMLVFTLVVSAIVFVLRKPLRKYKGRDLAIFQTIHFLRTEWGNRFMLAITFLGKHQFLLPANIILIIIFLIFGKHQWYAIRILMMSLSSLILMFVLKRLFHRKRPSEPLLFQAKGKSFPSGHAMTAVTFYGLLLYMLVQSNMGPVINTIAAIFTIVLIIAIGFSRVYLQVHYASDVLAGFIVGSTWLYISLHVLNRLQELYGLH